MDDSLRCCSVPLLLPASADGLQELIGQATSVVFDETSRFIAVCPSLDLAESEVWVGRRGGWWGARVVLYSSSRVALRAGNAARPAYVEVQGNFGYLGPDFVFCLRFSNPVLFAGQPAPNPKSDITSKCVKRWSRVFPSCRVSISKKTREIIVLYRMGTGEKIVEGFRRL